MNKHEADVLASAYEEMIEDMKNVFKKYNMHVAELAE